MVLCQILFHVLLFQCEKSVPGRKENISNAGAGGGEKKRDYARNRDEMWYFTPYDALNSIFFFLTASRLYLVWCVGAHGRRHFVSVVENHNTSSGEPILKQQTTITTTNGQICTETKKQKPSCVQYWSSLQTVRCISTVYRSRHIWLITVLKERIHGHVVEFVGWGSSVKPKRF